MHAVITNYPGFGSNLTCPQLPGLFWDVPDRGFGQDEVARVFHEVGVQPDYQLYLHRQIYQAQEGREWFVRCSESQFVQRRPTLRTLESLLAATPRPIDQSSKPDTDEALFIVVLASDRVRWVAEQLASGDAATIALLEPDGIALLNVSQASDGAPNRVEPDLTMAELFDTRVTLKRMQADFDVHGATDEREDARAQAQSVLV